jgi:hypothetical protein
MPNEYRPRGYSQQIIIDLGVSHRTSGIAKCGKFLVYFHSELQVNVNAAAFGKPVAAEEQLEPQKIGETQMSETKTREKGVTNMSGKNRATGQLPWWCVFILMAPLV